jgi:hypothetical protein
MLPSFRVHVAPRIPLKLGKAYYAMATAHAVLGTLAEGGGLYILLAVGTRLLPPRLRIRNYKLWMRTVLVLWWAVLLLGLATYARWYIPRFSEITFGHWGRCVHIFSVHFAKSKKALVPARNKYQ